MAFARREGGSAAVLFVDFDGFKAVNDTRGHAVGDEVLRQLAVRLRARLRDTDTVARWGGDEFVVVAERVEDGRLAAGLARKLLSVVADPVVVEGEALSVTASIGISLFPGDGDTAEQLIAGADAAMYAAKADGRDAFRYFSPQMHADARARSAFEQALRSGLEQGELELRYRPEWDVALDQLSGVDACIHWRRPGHEAMIGDEFLSAADSSGASVPLARWMLARMCEDAARLRAAGVTVPMGVRLTSRQLRDRTIAGDLGRLLGEWRLPSDALRIDIGEASVAPMTRDVTATLRDPQTLGVPMAIADFGAGCSSLASLTQLPVRSVRIASSVVARVAEDAGSAALAAAIVAMCRPLGLRVVADGVDSAVAGERLAITGCHLMQGSHIGRPVPVADVLGACRWAWASRVGGSRHAGRLWTGRGWRATILAGRPARRQPVERPLPQLRQPSVA